MIPPTEAEIAERLRGLRVSPPDGAFEERLWARLEAEPSPVRQLVPARRWAARRTLWMVAAVLIPTGALAGAGIWEASRPETTPEPAASVRDGVGERAASAAGSLRGPMAPVELEPSTEPAAAAPADAPAPSRVDGPRPGTARAAAPEGALVAETGPETPVEEPVAAPASSATVAAEPPLAVGRVRMSVGPSGVVTPGAEHDEGSASLRGAAATAPRSGAATGARPGADGTPGERAGEDAAGAARREREQQRERARQAGEGAERRERAGDDVGGPR